MRNFTKIEGTKLSLIRYGLDETEEAMKILMVCLGNICRSPLAEGILSDLVKKHNLDWTVDSAGTSGWHEGEKPDNRSIEVAKKYDIDISYQRSRKFISADLSIFDHILVMDSQNYQDVIKLCETEKEKERVELILKYSHPKMNKAVPDPYYEGGFEKVFMMIQEACKAFVEKHLNA